MTNLANLFEIQTDPRTFTQSNQLVLPRCCVGVEAELEQVRGINLRGLWTTKSDGSLHDDGLEYAFTHPLFGEDIITALTVLENAFYSRPPNVSSDTSLHVHIDVRDMEPMQLAAFFLLYVMYERILFNYCSVDRETNVFCSSVAKSKALIAKLARLYQNIKLVNNSAVYRDINSMRRYSGMNLNAVAKFGTVEFRGHPGEWRKEPILRWINILLSIKAAVVNNAVPLDKPYLSMKAQGAIEFSENIFHEYLPYLLSPNFHEQLYEGTQLARRIVNASQTEFLNSKLIKKGNSLFSAVKKNRANSLIRPRELAGLSDYQYSLYLTLCNMAIDEGLLSAEGERRLYNVTQVGPSKAGTAIEIGSVEWLMSGRPMRLGIAEMDPVAEATDGPFESAE